MRAHGHQKPHQNFHAGHASCGEVPRLSASGAVPIRESVIASTVSCLVFRAFLLSLAFMWSLTPIQRDCQASPPPPSRVLLITAAKCSYLQVDAHRMIASARARQPNPANSAIKNSRLNPVVKVNQQSTPPTSRYSRRTSRHLASNRSGRRTWLVTSPRVQRPAAPFVGIPAKPSPIPYSGDFVTY